MGITTDGAPSLRECEQWVADNWWSVLLACAILVPVAMTVFKFFESPFYIHEDSALFQHGGWYIGQGAALYVDIWDLKPPLIYAVTTVLAFLSFGNMAALHVLGVTAAVAAVSGGVVCLGLVVHRLTDDGVASVVAAVSMFGLTSVYAFPYAGIRPKYFAFLCAAGALLCAVDDRHLASGAAAALSAGFWQLGGGIAVLVVAMALQREGLEAAGRTVAGGVAVAAVTVLPFVLTGTGTALFVEAVIAPLYGVERYTVPGRILTFVVQLGYGALLVPLAAYGWWRGASTDLSRYGWVAAGGVTYLFQIFLEFQGAIEMILVYLFVALGIGVLVAEMPTPSHRVLVAGCVLLFVVTAPAWHNGTVAPLKEETVDLQNDFDVPDHASIPPDPEGVPSMQTIYWEKLKPDICHYRLGDKQKYFMAATNGTLDKAECGQWPFEETPST